MKISDHIIRVANFYSLLGEEKLNTIVGLLERVKGLEGDVAEVGVYRGGSAYLMANIAKNATVHLFDTFDGMPIEGEHDVHEVGDFHDTSLGHVQSLLKNNTNVEFYPGIFPGTADGIKNKKFKLVHIDGDQYQTTKDALEFFYPRLVNGGVMLFDDYCWENCPGVARAIHEFLKDKQEGVDLGKIAGPFQAVVIKGSEKDEYVHIRSCGRGIGDTVCALYAAKGLAETGVKVMYHTHMPQWVSRAAGLNDNLEIVQGEPRGAVDMNFDYEDQLKAKPDRKQWYCDNLATSLAIEPFKYAAPIVDKEIKQRTVNSDNYVVFSPYSSWSTREWSGKNWKELAKLFTNSGYDVVIIDADNKNKRLEKTFGGIKHTYWFWGMDADWVTDLLLGSRALIGNDSGMAHLAAMLDVKSVAIHSHCLPYQLWGGSNVIPVISSKHDCIGCNWQPDNGFVDICRYNCKAMNDGVTPQMVFDESGLGKMPTQRQSYTPQRDVIRLFNAIELHSKGDILEIGCNKGVTTAKIATHFPERHVYGIDYHELELAAEQQGEVPEQCDIGYYASQHSNVTVENVKSKDFKIPKTVDAIFIDGDHSYEGVKADTEMALKHLKKGVVMWHDAYKDCPDWCGVYRFLQELIEDGKDVVFCEDSWIAYLVIS